MKISKKIKEQIIADKEKLSIHEISKKYNLPRLEIEKIIKAASRETPKWFYAVLITLPIIALVILEITLRIFNYGESFDQWVDAGEGKYTINADIGRKYFTSGEFNPTTNEDLFDIQKKSNSFRVFVLGGSSSEGFPYSPMGAFSRYVRKRLELTYPNTKIEVVNLGMTGVNSYTLLDILPGVLDQKPDLILIYAGHNEYYGALGIGSTQSFASSRTLTRLILYLNDFKTTQLVRNAMQWITSSLFSSKSDANSGTLMSRMPKDKDIILNSDEYNTGLEQFKENLKDMLELIKDKNVPVILGRVVSNYKDQRPFISAETPGYKDADQVYKEAWIAFDNNSVAKADSLFRLAKDLDALRFRAPEKLNEIVDDLGKEFNVATVSIDSVFDSASPDGVTGDNLIVDHLHPNVKGYQLIGKAYYDSMEQYNYLPQIENANIPFEKQDSITVANFVFTKLDSVIGNYNIMLLKNNWPYVKERKSMANYNRQDFINMLQPKSFIDTIAVYKIQGMSWIDAHLLAAKTYLRKNDIKNYLKHIDVLLYQYPVLKDFNTLITYFYNRKKLDLRDYTAKRVGMIELNLGRYDDAIRHFSESYNFNPKDPLVLYNFSLVYFKKGDYEAALKKINECLTINPNYPNAKELKQQIEKQL